MMDPLFITKSKVKRFIMLLDLTSVSDKEGAAS